MTVILMLCCMLCDYAVINFTNNQYGHYGYEAFLRSIIINSLKVAKLISLFPSLLCGYKTAEVNAIKMDLM